MSAELELLAILGIFGGWFFAVGSAITYGLTLGGFILSFLGITTMMISGKYLRGDFKHWRSSR